jgi:hypothetical protein
MSRHHEIWAGAFVTEGTIVLRELGFEGMIEPIPDEESAIAALVPGRRRNVYGLTVGRRSHLFAYSDTPMEDCVLRVGVVAENAAEAGLAVTRKGLVYGFAAVEGDPAARTRWFRYDPSGDAVSSEMSLDLGKPESIECPLADQQVSRIALAPDSDRLYALTTEGALFAWDIGTRGHVALGDLREFDEGRVSKALCVADDGRLYAVAGDGVVVRLDPSCDRIQRTGMAVPAGKGKEYVNEATCLVWDPSRRAIYGGTSADGYLFRIEPDVERVICLGKPTEQRPIRCLAVGLDGLVYGVVGEPRTGMPHLFRYEPESGDLRDLGIPKSTIVKLWVAHEIDAMCVIRNGHVVMGERDRISHLLIYYPPVQRRDR